MMQVLCVSQECPQRRDCLRSCESPIEKNQLYADYYIGGISCIMKVEKGDKKSDSKEKLNADFYAGQKVAFKAVAWDSLNKKTKDVVINGTIRYCYNFKEVAQVWYHDPIDGQITKRDFQFSEIWPI